MRNILFMLVALMPMIALSARPEGGAHGGAGAHFNAGTGSRYDASRHEGSDYMHNEQWRNRTYVDPNYYYGGGYAQPYVNNGPGPGEVDDSDALYESYLQSNPRIPSPM